jgi:hypothetical protein
MARSVRCSNGTTTRVSAGWAGAHAFARAISCTHATRSRLHWKFTPWQRSSGARASTLLICPVRKPRPSGL